MNGPSLSILRFEVPAFQLQIQPLLRGKWLSSWVTSAAPLVSPMPAWSLQQLTTVPWREELGRMKMRERAGAGGFPQQTEKPLSKEGTVVHRAGRGTLIPSSKKGYLMPGDSPPTEPVPAGRRPPGEVAEDQCPGVPSLPCRGLQLGFSCTSAGCSHINLKKPLQPLVGCPCEAGRELSCFHSYLQPHILPAHCPPHSWGVKNIQQEHVNKFTNMELNLLSSQTVQVTVAS